MYTHCPTPDYRPGWLSGKEEEGEGKVVLLLILGFLFVWKQCNNQPVGTRRQTNHLHTWVKMRKRRFAFAFFSLCFDAATIAAGKEVDTATSGEIEWRCTPSRMRGPAKRARRSSLATEHWAAKGEGQVELSLLFIF